MKRTLFILTVLLALMFAGFAHAGGILLFNDATATSTSGVAIFGTGPFSEHSVQVYYTDANASISALIVTLEGSIDTRATSNANATWYELAEHTFSAGELTAKQAMFHVVNKSVSRVRLKITTLTGEGTGDVISAIYEGK